MSRKPPYLINDLNQIDLAKAMEITNENRQFMYNLDLDNVVRIYRKGYSIVFVLKANKERTEFKVNFHNEASFNKEFDSLKDFLLKEDRLSLIK